MFKFTDICSGHVMTFLYLCRIVAVRCQNDSKHTFTLRWLKSFDGCELVCVKVQYVYVSWGLSDFLYILSDYLNNCSVVPCSNKNISLGLSYHPRSKVVLSIFLCFYWQPQRGKPFVVSWENVKERC